jgi:hypothetical protein
MRVLFLGDIVGNCGRDAVLKTVPRLRSELGLDFVVANGENISGGRGIVPKAAEALFNCGVDVITGGNHSFQHNEVYPYMEETPALLRPNNFPEGTPGYGVAHVGDLTVVNVIGRTFMLQEVDDPFRAADRALKDVPPGRFVLIDFHGEATSEKQAIGWYLDGRVTAVVGTHTHVPTADARLLPQGTAFCTDTGMCGARDSIIGDEVEPVLRRFLTQMPTRLPAATGVAQINGLLIEADSDGKAVSIERCDRVVC